MTRLASRLSATAAILLLVAAGLVFQRVFEFGVVVRALVPSVLITFAATWFVTAPDASDGETPVRRRALGLLVGVTATVFCALAVALLVAEPGAGREAAKAVRLALTSGWSRILTTTLPVAPIAERLAVVALTSGVASTLTALALRGRRPEWAFAPPLALVTSALLLGVGGAGHWMIVTAPVLIGCALLGVSLSRRPEAHRGSEIDWQQRAVAVTTLLVALFAGALVAPLLPARTPFDLRRVVEPPVDPQFATDPMAELSRRQTLDASANMFTAQVPASLSRDQLPWRLASFDAYDGLNWSMSRTVSSVGENLQMAGDTPSDPHQVQIIVQQLGGPWIPTLGNPLRVNASDLRYDRGLNTLLSAGALEPGARLELTVTVPKQDADQISTAAVGAKDPTLRAVPDCMPKSLAQLADRVKAGGGTPAQLAQRLATELRSYPQAINTAQADPGASCARLAALLTSTDRRATSEQFATAFALAARRLGLPTRVAVGFRPGQQVKDGRVLVRGSDAFVWPEVSLAGVGWVAFDPTPAAAGDNRPQIAPPPIGKVGAQESQQPSTPPTKAPAAPPAAQSSGRGWLWAPVVLGALLLVGLALLLVAPLLALRRRKTRQAGDARHRITGAWLELLDELALAKVKVPGATATSVAETVARRWPEGDSAVWDLARLANRALYDPREPAEEEAVLAWRQLRVVDDEVKAEIPWRRRLTRPSR